MFATIINTGTDTALACGIAPVTQLPVTPLFQTTDRNTNALTGTANTPVNIGPGDFQTFLIALTDTAAFGASDIAFSFGCANRPSATVIPGVNTLLMSGSDVPTPDIIALGVTPSRDGIINIDGASGTGIFSIATFNVGATGSITVSADTGGAGLPVTLILCETDPGSGVCKASPASSVTTTINTGSTPTFALFAQGSDVIAFSPGVNRAFVRFSAGSTPVGATSAALRTR